MTYVCTYMDEFVQIPICLRHRDEPLRVIGQTPTFVDLTNEENHFCLKVTINVLSTGC